MARRCSSWIIWKTMCSVCGVALSGSDEVADAWEEGVRGAGERESNCNFAISEARTAPCQARDRSKAALQVVDEGVGVIALGCPNRADISPQHLFPR